MTAEQKEETAMRLLEEVAREKHAGDAVLLHVRFVGVGGRVLELLDAGVSSAASTSPASSPAAPCG